MYGPRDDDDDLDRPNLPRRGAGTSGPTGTSGGRLAICDGCGTLERKVGNLKNCGKCRQTRYCSRDCQLKHWKQGHKKKCAMLAASAASSNKK
jgi:MYND finger